MQEDDSKLKKIVVPVLAVAILITLVAWMAGAFHDKVIPGEKSIETPDNLELLEKTAFVIQEVARDTYEPVPAGVVAKQNSTISSRILASIDKVHVRAGQNVKKGQLLVELEKADLLSRVSQAQSALSSAQARLIEADSSLVRALELSKKGLVSHAALEQSQANFDSLEAEQQRAEQALVEAQTALDYAQIRSPIEGLIVDRFAEPGNTAQPGMPLLSLYNPNSLQVEAHVRETLAVSLELGDQLRVTIPSLGQQLESVLEEMVPAGNAASRTFLIKSRVQLSGLLPGMYARLYVPSGKVQNLLLPQDRVAEVGQLNVVWVLDDKQISRRFVRLGDRHEGEMLEVISGLNVGDRILPVQE